MIKQMPTRFIQRLADILGFRPLLHSAYEWFVEKRRELWTRRQMRRMKKFVHRNKNNPLDGKQQRSHRIVVSLTSFPERVKDEKVLGICLFSIFCQTFRPDEVVLWLSEEEFGGRNKKLPEYLQTFVLMGLTIRWTESQKCFTKLIPALEAFPDDVIVTADDDVFYGRRWLAGLYKVWCKNPDSIVAHRIRRVSATSTNIATYLDWPLVVDSPPSVLNFLTGVGGVLYPPMVLHKTVFERKLREEISPLNDDIWFWGMAILNGRKICSAKNAKVNPHDLIPEKKEAQHLFSENIEKNDAAIARLLAHFPEVRARVTEELFGSNQIDMSERIHPELSVMSKESYLLYLRSLFAYEYTLKFVKPGAKVLEIGYGDGYGARHMAAKSPKTLFYAIDIFKELELGDTTEADLCNCQFMTYDGVNIPFEDGFFDVVISFQVIEHVDDVPRFLSEIKRVLKPDGTAMITTPNRTYRLCDGQEPANKFHLREYSADQLEAELGRVFGSVKVAGVMSSPEIMKAEWRRVRNGRADYSLPQRISDLFHRQVINRFRSASWRRGCYSTADFYVSQVNVEKALDLLATVGDENLG